MAAAAMTTSTSMAAVQPKPKLMGLPSRSLTQLEIPHYKPSWNGANTERLKTATPTRKSMRQPARQLCQLSAVDYAPPLDDYNELSRILRISTVPGYSVRGECSEYKEIYSPSRYMKDKMTTSHNMKRDWLSTWGEFNVKEQRWRKAWVEKFGAEK